MKNILSLLAAMFILFFVGCEEDKVEIDQFGSISGVVFDGETYEPLSGVLLGTNPASSSTISTESGTFLFQKVIKGDVVITAHKKDYLTNSVSVAVYPYESTDVTFYLIKDENNVGRVEIYDPVPGNGATSQDVELTLSWKVDQQYVSKELEYTVYYFKSNSTVQQIAGENLLVKETNISNLDYEVTYYWYVVAKYEGTRVANSPTWSFQTRSYEDTTKRNYSLVPF